MAASPTKGANYRSGGSVWGKYNPVQSPGPRNHEGHYYPWAWRDKGGRRQQHREGKRFVFWGPPGRSCDLQKLIQPTHKDSKERKLEKGWPEVPPPCPLISSSSSPFAKFNNKRARGLWTKTRDQHFSSIKDQTESVSGFSTHRVPLATPWICSCRVESTHQCADVNGNSCVLMRLYVQTTEIGLS